uniref:Uncharacterized protein n=1 Tax=Human herpesvirus 2 TaxID=10310 RepID=A0A481TP03_HHV2|nr:hypothetical protein [Human alphaherpesvirus 2]
MTPRAAHTASSGGPAAGPPEDSSQRVAHNLGRRGVRGPAERKSLQEVGVIAGVPEPRPGLAPGDDVGVDAL